MKLLTLVILLLATWSSAQVLNLYQGTDIIGLGPLPCLGLATDCLAHSNASLDNSSPAAIWDESEINPGAGVQYVRLLRGEVMTICSVNLSIDSRLPMLLRDSALPTHSIQSTLRAGHSRKCTAPPTQSDAITHGFGAIHSLTSPIRWRSWDSLRRFFIMTTRAQPYNRQCKSWLICRSFRIAFLLVSS
jgi:hypothetical protein